MGVVTPVGNEVSVFWENLVHGRSGIGPITHFDASQYDCRIAGEVRDFEPVKHFKTPKDVRRTDRFTHLAVGAAKMALEEAGLTAPVADPERFGVMLGSGIGGLKTTEDQHTVLMNKGPGRLSPFMIPMLISNMASGIVSMEYGLQGPNFATGQRLRDERARDRRGLAHDSRRRCGCVSRRRLRGGHRAARHRRIRSDEGALDAQ
jgi:3-oxoacyl-[acyl-carrier-protein] synthase II